MNKIVVIGLAGIGVVWGVISWIMAHGFLDFVSLVFIIISIIALSFFTVTVLRGGFDS